MLVLLVLILPSFAWLFRPGYFPIHDDLQVMRQYQMDKCFADWQIPCRWTPDLGFGYGYPLFNYYPPLPYLIGQPFAWLGFQYIDIAKIVGIIGFLICALFTYLLAREFFGPKGGLLSALFYTYAPYHSVDFWVRAAVNEFYAMAFYPAILLSLYLLIKTGNRKYIFWSSLSVAGLMLSHNLMLLIFFPVAVIWTIFWLIKLKKFNHLFYLIISGAWALGLASFFTLPVIFESKYAHIETLTMGYFNFLAHFLNIRQIFIFPNWSYGSSELGPDTMSFFLGYLHWYIPLIVILIASLTRKLKTYRLLLYLLSLFALFSLFMTHNKSTFIWEKLFIIQSLQFPWRFLTISVFMVSFISGAIVLINKKILPYLLLLLLLLNANYFRPRLWYPDLTDEKKFSGLSWQYQITSGIFDYLPIFAKAPPADQAGDHLNLISGAGEWQTVAKRSNFQSYRLDITSDRATAEIQTYYFPGWTAYLNGQKQAIDPARDSLLGRIQVDLSRGQNHLVLKFQNTPIRTMANTISLISWLALFGVVVGKIRPLPVRKSLI